jgi:dTDP-4-amino-4,6-dideoxygalactose transaminase
MKINVLITGAGGNLGHFIHEALLQSNLNHRIIACDYSPNALGLYQADVGYVVPPAKTPEYIPRLLDICQEEGIHLILVGGMVEMHILSENKKLIQEKTGAFVVASDPEALKRMEDKWELTQYLKEMGFDYPRSVLPHNEEAVKNFVETYGFPLIVKDRFGAGSKGLCNLKYIDAILQKRKAQWMFYKQLLKGLQAQLQNDGLMDDEYNYAYFPVVFESEEQLQKSIEGMNLLYIYPRRYFYPSLNKLNYVEYCDCPVAESISNRVLCLPLYHELSTSEQEMIARVLLRVQNNP